MEMIAASILVLLSSITLIFGFLTLKFVKKDNILTNKDINKIGYLGFGIFFIVLAISPRAIKVQAKMNAFEKVKNKIALKEMKAPQPKPKQVVNLNKIG